MTVKISVWFGNACFSIQEVSHNWGSWPHPDPEGGEDQTLQEMWLSSLLFLLAFITTVNNRKTIQKHQELEKNMGQRDFWRESGTTFVILIHENVFQLPHARVEVLLQYVVVSIYLHIMSCWRALLISYQAGEQIFNNTKTLNNTALSGLFYLLF